MLTDSSITTFFHCRQCMAEKLPGIAPREWARLEVGWTEKGVQVWCVRHNLNVIHIDFLTQKVDYAQSE